MGKLPNTYYPCVCCVVEVWNVWKWWCTQNYYETSFCLLDILICTKFMRSIWLLDEMCENGDVWTLITISLPILIGKACFFIEKHVDIK